MADQHPDKIQVPESPTTARELDFDEETHGVIPESGALSPEPPANHAPKRVSFQEQEEAPPPKPPRPMSPQAQAEATLIEAFPSIDATVVKAVLVASGGKVEPAFNALLGMSDPNFVAEPEERPPPRPPRPTTNPRSQLEQDELYARQLAEHYEQSAPEGFGSRERGDPPLPRRRQDTGLKPNELYEDREHSFFDDDLPVIRQNIQKSFQDTQQKVGKWITDFRKRLDGDEDEPTGPQVPAGPTRHPRQDFGSSRNDQLYGIRRSAEATRRSGDRDRYDADPRVLSDDFARLEMEDNDPSPQHRSTRPLANPDLFKPATVATQNTGPVDEVDALYGQSPQPNRQPSPGTGSKPGKKWQPLTSVAPNPEVEDHDPFSLGDSDEEQDKKQDLKPEDTERLKKLASESGGGSRADGLKPAERSGSVSQKDKDAEELLAGVKP